MHEIFNNNQISLNRTEEVSDIIEKYPKRFGYYVTMIILIIVLLLATFGWLIKYPEVLIGEITITGINSPVKLAAQTNGKIVLLKKEQAKSIGFNEDIALIKNTANYLDVELLSKLLNKIELLKLHESNFKATFPSNLSVGELNSKYFVFYNAALQYIDYKRLQPYQQQDDIGKKLLISRELLQIENNEEIKRLKTKYELAIKLLKRDSLLFEKKLIPESDLEKSLLNTITRQQELKSINREIANNTYLLNEADTRLKQVEIQRVDKERENTVILYNAYFSLLEGIKEWERKFVIKSPISGFLEFLNFTKDDDFVQTGQELFSIIPNKNQLIGQVYLPEIGAGRVKIGQDVIIKLNNYPYIQYGSLHGKVQSISSQSNRQISSANPKSNIGAYLVYVNLPKGLETNFGTTLNFQFEIKGIAEIITDDRRIIERLFDNLRYRVK